MSYPNKAPMPAFPLPSRTAPTAALRFAVDKKAADRRLEPGEHYYRIELTDGREVLVAAENITIDHGALAASTADCTTLTLAPGTWVSAYRCAVLSVPWSILHLEAPA